MKYPGVCIMCALLLGLTLFVFNPATVYQNNVHEFSTTLGGLLSVAAKGVAALILGVAAIFLVLDRVGWHRLLAVGAVVTLFVWAQSNLLTFSYGKLDGSGLDFAANAWRMSYEIPLWLGAIAFALWRPSPILRNSALLASLLIAAQTGLLIAGMWSEPEGEDRASRGQIPQDYFRYGGSTNVLHLVLDEFGSAMMDSVLAKRTDLVEAFDGFTFYRDTTGLFPTTNVSMHAILTGQIYDYSEPLADQIARELPVRSLAAVLGGDGFDTHLVAKYYLCQRMGQECRIVPGTSQSDQSYNDSLQLLDYGLFRAAPHLLKVALFGPSAELLQSRFAVGDEAMRTLPYQAVAFLEQAIKHSRFDESLPPQYNFYHVALPHLPAVTDVDCNYIGKQAFSKATFLVQSECAANITSRLLARLKEIGAYDNTLIVIHSDHGSWFDIGKVAEEGPGRPSAWDMSRSSALLMVKPPHSHGSLVTNDAPASLADIRPTILETLGVAGAREVVQQMGARASGGVDLSSLSEGSNRVRRYWGFEWKGALTERDFLPKSNEFSIRGLHTEQSNWLYQGESSGSCVYAVGDVIDLNRTAPIFPFCVSSGLSAPEAQHTWTNKEAVTLQFELEPSSYAGNGVRLRLRAGAFIPDDLALSASVSVAGETLGEFEFQKDVMRDLVLFIPHRLIGMSLELNIAINSPRRPIDLGLNDDKRALGLRLYQFELTNG